MLFPATILFRRQFARAYFEIRYALHLVCLDERELLTRSFSPLFFSSVAYREGNCEKEKKEKRYVRRSRRRTRLTPLLFDGFPREEQHEGGGGNPSGYENSQQESSTDEVCGPIKNIPGFFVSTAAPLMGSTHEGTRTRGFLGTFIRNLNVVTWIKNDGKSRMLWVTE